MNRAKDVRSMFQHSYMATCTQGANSLNKLSHDYKAMCDSSCLLGTACQRKKTHVSLHVNISLVKRVSLFRT